MNEKEKLNSCLDFLYEIKEFMASIIGNRPSFNDLQLDGAINYLKEVDARLFDKSHDIIWFINGINEKGGI